VSMYFKLMAMALIGLFFASCSTTPLKRFEAIQVGMYKDDVLDTLGSPNESRFKNGENIWNYRFVTDSGPVAKEVRLKNDHVTAVGDVPPPSGDKLARLKVGMTKAQVLDLAGFPMRSEANGENTVWTYSSSDTKSANMSVEFSKENAIYVGPSVTKKSDPSDGFVPIEN
jgi:outer membrane protein assembly factor BamE (lipoprotein component of BamABCDE complex)